jgi:hypothetical protein
MWQRDILGKKSVLKKNNIIEIKGESKNNNNILNICNQYNNK